MNLVLENKASVISSPSDRELTFSPTLRTASIIGDGINPENNPLKDSSLYNRTLPLEERFSRGMKELEQYVTERQRKLTHVPDDSIKLREINVLTKLIRLYARLKTNGQQQIEIIDAVQDLQTSDYRDVLKEACSKLKGVSDSDALRVLCEVGLKDCDLQFRSYAAKALQGTTEPTTLKWLCEIGLRDPIAVTRRASAIALQGTVDADTVKTLCQMMLEDSDWKIRDIAAQALNGTTNHKAIDALCIATTDSNTIVCLAAATSLGTCQKMISNRTISRKIIAAQKNLATRLRGQ